jgi:N-acetylmuramoyl-L-alanine amidase
MKRILLGIGFLLTVALAGTAFGQSLSGLIIVIDPGHGGFESDDRHVIPDPGTDFWESESNFRKALHLKPLLEQQGATVYLTRNGNTDPELDDPSLTARWQFANSVNADWFHSIHSNAAGGTNPGINYTMVLIKENISTRQPAFPEAVTMSSYIYNKIRAKIRTSSSSGNIVPGVYLDYTFYGGTSGGYNLGVLSGLVMPGELSEGSFHDWYPETRRLMNNNYRKMEAYGIRNAMMQYFGVSADTLATIAGIQSTSGPGTLVNYSQVRLLPGNRITTGDQYNNGFYMFDSLNPGNYTVIFETPGYFADTVDVTVTQGQNNFLDRSMESTSLPTVVSSVPVNNDTSFNASTPVKLTFSKIMDTASVRMAFSITPSVNGSLLWSGNNTVLTFDPDSVVLPFDQTFTVKVDTGAKSESGLPFDGNGDGTAGDPFLLTFKTKPVDAWPPVLVTRYPVANDTVFSIHHVVCLTFDEPLDPTSVNTTNIVIQIKGGLTLARTVQYWERNGQGGINVYVTGGFTADRTYRVRVSGVKDLSGNAIPTATPLVWEFSIGPQQYITTTIDDFNGTLDNWFQPASSGSTTGITSATFLHDATAVPVVASNAGSANLTFHWNTGAGSWLIREYLNAGAPRSILWRKHLTRLQAYVLGDGSGTTLRFAVDDSVDVFPGGNATNHEVSEWIPIDWVGWRLVEWDLENDPVGSWIGNGILEGQMRFDSFQLSYVPGTSADSGSVLVDQLQLAVDAVTPVESADASVLPTTFALYQNYPNPFNPETRITFDLPSESFVRLAVYDLLGRQVRTLVSEQKTAGTYSVSWDARDESGSRSASGVYVYRLEAGTHTLTMKMLLLK